MDQIRLDPIEVVVGVIARSGQILIAKKRPDQGRFTAGQWEFPGGKVEDGETKIKALRRELLEELGIQVEVVRLLDSVTHILRNKTETLKIYLFVFLCRPLGDPKALEHEELRWVAPDEMISFDISPADREIIPTVIEAVRTS